MSVLAWRPRTRILLFGLLVVLLAAATVVVGGRQSAQAFDCKRGEPKPTSCPFIKIQQQGMRYNVEAQLLDPNGARLYQWKETEPKYTLWHWRYQGNQDRIQLDIGNPLPKENKTAEVFSSGPYRFSGQ